MNNEMLDVKEIIEQVDKVENEQVEKPKKRRRRKKKEEFPQENIGELCLIVQDTTLMTLEQIKQAVKGEGLNSVYKNIWQQSFLKVCEKYAISEKFEEKPELMLFLSTALLFIDATNEEITLTL